MLHNRSICLSCLLAVVVVLSSCENNLKEVEQIASKKLNVPLDRSTGVELIYSDNAIVKAKLITP